MGNQRHHARTSVQPKRRALIFLIWSAFMAAVAMSGVYYLVARQVPSALLMLNVLLMVGLLAAAFSTGAPRPPVKSCLGCRAEVFPTRNPNGLKLWTCFTCGREAPRRRSIQEIYAAGMAALRPPTV